MSYVVNDHNIFVIIICSFLISFISVPFIRWLALKIKAYKEPSERDVHIGIIPRMGGLAIFISFVICHFLFGYLNNQMCAILIGAGILVLTGIYDDVRGMRPVIKFALQVIAAYVAVCYGDIALKEITAFDIYINFGSLSKPISIAFIVSIINAINLIDGLDGLASGISAIYFLTIAIIASILNKMGGLDIVLTLIMFGATLGFLPHNFHPAKIFLGDTGSMFLGFIISVIALLGFKNVTLTSLIVPVLILAIPILDTLFAIFRRIIKGESIGNADREHFHHQILKKTNSPVKAVMIIYLINILFACVSIFYVLGNSQLAAFIYVILMIGLLFVVLKTNVLFENKKEKNNDLKS